MKMENRTPISPDNPDAEKAIHYVMGGMDPAEAAEFRARMEKDQNLLIEVEALRRTNARLQQLPVFSAPPAVLAAVIKQSEPKPGFVYRFRYAAVAAGLSLAVMAGAYSMMSSSGSAPEIPVAEQPVPVLTKPEPSNPGVWKDRQNVVTIDQVSSQPDSATQVHPRMKAVQTPGAPTAADRKLTLTRAQ
jgi:hypothetical protein